MSSEVGLARHFASNCITSLHVLQNNVLASLSCSNASRPTALFFFAAAPQLPRPTSPPQAGDQPPAHATSGNAASDIFGAKQQAALLAQAAALAAASAVFAAPAAVPPHAAHGPSPAAAAAFATPSFHSQNGMLPSLQTALHEPHEGTSAAHGLAPLPGFSGAAAAAGPMPMAVASPPASPNPDKSGSSLGRKLKFWSTHNGRSNPPAPLAIPPAVPLDGPPPPGSQSPSARVSPLPPVSPQPPGSPGLLARLTSAKASLTSAKAGRASGGGGSPVSPPAPASASGSPLAGGSRACPLRLLLHQRPYSLRMTAL